MALFLMVLMELGFSQTQEFFDHTQILFPTNAQSRFLRSYMFRLRIVAIIMELQYIEDKSSVSYVGKYVYISFL
jgi:hypothetical protein